MSLLYWHIWWKNEYIYIYIFLGTYMFEYFQRTLLCRIMSRTLAPVRPTSWLQWPWAHTSKTCEYTYIYIYTCTQSYISICALYIYEHLRIYLHKDIYIYMYGTVIHVGHEILSAFCIVCPFCLSLSYKHIHKCVQRNSDPTLVLDLGLKYHAGDGNCVHRTCNTCYATSYTKWGVLAPTERLCCSAWHKSGALPETALWKGAQSHSFASDGTAKARFVL